MASEGIFNNREIAIGIWAVVALGAGLSNRGMRSSMKTVVQAFLQPAILRVYAAMVAYVALIVAGLRAVGLWEPRQLKDTIIWFVFVAAASLFRLPQSADDHVYFEDAIKDNLKLIVFIEFVVTFYPFDLSAELAIVPVSVLVGLMIVLAERDERLKGVAKFLNGMVLVAGAAVLGSATYRLVKDLLGFATQQTLADFSMPVVLSVLFLPFIFVMTIVSNYQFESKMLQRAIKDDALRAYARRTAWRRFGWRTSLVKRWRRDLFLDDYRTNDDIDRSIDAVLERYRREKDPPIVPPSEGWSPYSAKEFLASEGLSAGDYEPVPGQCWRAWKSRNVSDRKSLSTLEYYVEGDSIVATMLGLELNAFQSEPIIDDMKEFMRLAVVLYQAAVQQKMPEELMEAILGSETVERTVDGRVIASKYKDWAIKDRSGFTLEFCIRMHKHGSVAALPDRHRSLPSDESVYGGDGASQRG